MTEVPFLNVSDLLFSQILDSKTSHVRWYVGVATDAVSFGSSENITNEQFSESTTRYKS